MPQSPAVRPAARGIKAASPTLSIPNSATSDAGGPTSERLRKKNGSAASQFHCFPPIVRMCAGPPGNPCQAKPQTKYARTATEKTQSDDIIKCAALRERLSPVLIRASPAAAHGIKKMKTTQSAVAVSERAGGVGISGAHREAPGVRGLRGRAQQFPRRNRQPQRPRAERFARVARGRSTRVPILPATAENPKVSRSRPPPDRHTYLSHRLHA